MITDTLSLKNAIAAYAHRTDLTTVMDLFIQAATERLGVDLKTIDNEHRQSLAITGDKYVLPPDFREMRTVTGATSGVLRPIGLFDENEFVDTASFAVGYLLEGSAVNFQYQLSLIPATGEGLVIDYWQVPAALVNDTDTSNVLLVYSNIYLAACMVEYSAYAVNAEQSILWDAKYKAGVQAANDRATKAQYGVGLAKSAPARWYNNAPPRAM